MTGSERAAIRYAQPLNQLRNAPCVNLGNLTPAPERGSMAPSSIHVIPITAKKAAPSTQVRIEAGPARLAAASVASSQPDPIWTLTASAIKPNRLICCFRWASLAS